MPIYEYECTDCGNLIEVIQKIGARAPGRCEKCTGKLKKKISRASFQLKGGGWYSDGYGSSDSSSSDSEGTPKKDEKDKKDKKDKTEKKGKDGKSSKSKKATSA
jgi:putative FmdB family regulatory protein